MDDELTSVKDTIRTLAQRLDPLATAVAIVAALAMIVVLHVHWAVSILLAEGIYAGVWLIRDAGRPSEPPPPTTPLSDDFAYITKSRSAAESIAGSSAWLQNWAAQESAGNRNQDFRKVRSSINDGPVLNEIGTVVKEINRMMRAIEEDAVTRPSKLAAAPLYSAKFVDPFEQYLAKLVKLLDREVVVAANDWERFNLTTLPNFVTTAEKFYQEYHNQDVLDLAVLEEILRDNLESVDDDWGDDDQGLFDDLRMNGAGDPTTTSNVKSPTGKTQNGGDQ